MLCIPDQSAIPSTWLQTKAQPSTGYTSSALTLSSTRFSAAWSSRVSYARAWAPRTRGFSITPGPFPSSARTSSSRSGLPLCALSPLPPDGIRRTVTVGARRERAAAIRRTERRRRGVRLGTAGRSPHRRRNPRPARAFSPLRPRASSSPPGSNGLEFSPPKERRLAFPFFLGFCLSPQHDA